jgi:peptidoglycan/LPS O-acetylase OafA/YrhL
MAVEQTEIQPRQEGPASRRAERLAFIDGLRALAALGVVAFHFSGHAIFKSPPGGVAGALLAAAKYGNEGVPVFFVITVSF